MAIESAIRAELLALRRAFNAAEKLRDPSHVRAIPVEELFALFERTGLRARLARNRIDWITNSKVY